MAISAAPPSFVQQNYYASYPQGNPPPYTEYAQEIEYLSAPQVPANDSGFWESSRNDASRLISEQAGPYVHSCKSDGLANFLPTVHTLTRISRLGLHRLYNSPRFKEMLSLLQFFNAHRQLLRTQLLRLPHRLRRLLLSLWVLLPPLHYQIRRLRTSLSNPRVSSTISWPKKLVK